MRREWIEMEWCVQYRHRRMSPSMRREWIEIDLDYMKEYKEKVSLHAEGVD